MDDADLDTEMLAEFTSRAHAAEREVTKLRALLAERDRELHETLALLKGYADAQRECFAVASGDGQAEQVDGMFALDAVRRLRAAYDAAGGDRAALLTRAQVLHGNLGALALADELVDAILGVPRQP